MDERLIVVTAEPGYADTIVAMAEQAGILDCAVFPTEGEPPRESVHLLVSADRRQKVLDKLQSILGSAENWRIAILPVEATIPRIEEEEQDKAARADAKEAAGESREELYNDVAHNARVDANFLVFVALSTVVAAIGLIENNVAVVIGAMVIAPLLGPNMSLAFAAALGDTRLAIRSLSTNVAGIAIALLITVMIGLIWPLNFNSHELVSRTDVGLEGIVLALASGMAAVLSLTVGVATSLVGVMVAVALLPPTATLGLMLGAGNYQMALGALLLLAVNVVCVNLAAKLTFFLSGVRPRTWWQKKKARQSLITYIVFWIVALVVLLVVIQVHHRYLAKSVEMLVD
jgi:uncharacterized hydrophobic protein (TIGR00341 family)